ncbi:hypothetical protein GCM10011611_04050 [Aliidongia dinghuensis]|uniref:Uncharacterized protein n=1 Tax=Aliidongia dinghuensis TaxID=1867774 RepID=A0A8J3E0G7_9PROT|nr:hypothetical protein [Aliidongia dinghuensis]GGF01740.1 hypothetical protein GCM10011611_04050 [Aliidongia dinghuensis]
MSWLGITITWIVGSIVLPMLYAWRCTVVQSYREKAIEARARLHRFHFKQPLPSNVP